MKWYIGLTALAVLIAYGIETQEPDSRYGVTRRKAQSQVLFAAVFLLLSAFPRAGFRWETIMGNT